MGQRSKDESCVIYLVCPSISQSMLESPLMFSNRRDVRIPTAGVLLLIPMVLSKSTKSRCLQ